VARPDMDVSHKRRSIKNVPELEACMKTAIKSILYEN